MGWFFSDTVFSASSAVGALRWWWWWWWWWWSSSSSSSSSSSQRPYCTRSRKNGIRKKSPQNFCNIFCLSFFVLFLVLLFVLKQCLKISCTCSHALGRRCLLYAKAKPSHRHHYYFSEPTISSILNALAGIISMIWRSGPSWAPFTSSQQQQQHHDHQHEETF